MWTMVAYTAWVALDPNRVDDVVHVTGPPVELLLFLYGRQAIAQVEVTGTSPAAVDTAKTAAFGI